MEALVQPPTWDGFRPEMRPVFEALRSPAGEQMVLEQNMFVEQMLPRAMLRTLTEAEMSEYRRPFAEPNEPAGMAEIISSYADWLPRSTLPKLLVKGESGALLASGAQVEFCRGWASQSEVTVRGIHFLQEDSPDEIGRALADWLRGLA